MLQNQNRAYPHHQQQHHHTSTANNLNSFSAQQHLAPTTSSFHPDLSCSALDLTGFDSADNLNYKSLSSSPISSTQSLSQFSSLGSSPLSTFDSIPTPRGASAYEGSLFDYSPQSHPATLAEPPLPLFPTTADLMQTDTWNGQLTPRSVGRFSHHQRESSLSSLGSNGPASPYSHNTTNPQIAVTDSLGDGFQGFTGHEDFNYQLTAAKPFPGVSHDTFYTGLPAFGSSGSTSITGYPQLAAATKRKHDRGLLQHSENPIGPNRSQPVSVASSINSDSPATPAGDLEEDRRNKNAMHTVPKLDRTMTDVYADELYNPNFNITSSAAPSQVPVTSPTHDMFVQRIQAANNQHLNAASPVSATSRDRSPFRQGSPLAPMSVHDFGRFGSAQQMREQNKLQDARAAQQQFGRSVHTTTPPATISPKDALLDFHEAEGEANYPLFPQQQNNNGGSNANHSFMDAMSKPPAAQSQQAFDGLPMDTNMFSSYLNQMPQLSVQVPQQYPFIAQPRQQSSVPSLNNGSLATTRVSSVDVGGVDSSLNKSPRRPVDTTTDGGTYTCTYHGCTQRFETPALLQKHKREGHRQAHGLNGARRPDSLSGLPSNMMSQAGPHRCDRINPSTGKPCNTVFSRPYDLTRHEDTIHNARKQKVRCNLCTDEKTFSRADALTRHYRVCHPDVEFPGKRRRGGHSG
ncbi:hypothetical protein QBC42DRAFT_302995 [Cladorrhinum samala]|uniref:C2H2-type domain-containing protein n=1 Tax=Cladorrhinum samala TaxID=585594 RepID=A0AAV9HYL8_9PEZI|nr:hypothetical protein QBC42DRAFT_302995 [Cladorrhinum samala]